VFEALRTFGAALFDLGVDDLWKPDTVFQIGLPPSRIDILSSISGVDFDDAWARRMEVTIGDLRVGVIGRTDFIANKRAAGRRISSTWSCFRPNSLRSMTPGAVLDFRCEHVRLARLHPDRGRSA
jgi:hypothetical protein